MLLLLEALVGVSFEDKTSCSPLMYSCWLCLVEDSLALIRAVLRLTNKNNDRHFHSMLCGHKDPESLSNNMSKVPKVSRHFS